MIKDITGQKFNRLTVLEFAGYKEMKSGRRTLWKCQCDCGNIVYATGNALQRNNTKSCGCLKLEAVKQNWIKNTRHGMSHSRLYDIWHGIKFRCMNEKSYEYDTYGGRGITICDEWKNDFSKFMEWALSNGYSDDLSIDRIDVNGNYCPENCRWATLSEQARNKRDSRYLTAFGKTQTLADWADEYNMIPETISYRLSHGYTLERALTEIPNPERFITYNGETHTVTEWSKIIGMDSSVLSARLNMLGWSEERALTEPARKKGRKNKANPPDIIAESAIISRSSV